MKNVLAIIVRIFKCLRSAFRPMECHYLNDHTLRDLGLHRDEYIRTKAVVRENRKGDSHNKDK